MSGAMIGYDTRFAIETSPGSRVFVELDEVFEVTPPSATVSEVDATHNKSPDRRKESIPGLTDSGDASLQMNFIPGSISDQRIEHLRTNGDVVGMQITYPNGVTVDFDGWVKEYTKAVPLEDRLTATVNFRVTGAVTISSSVAPANTILPAVSGTVQAGQTLTAFEGVWTGAVSFTFQWQQEISGVWTDIGGATGKSMVVPGGATVGRPLRVIVTGINAAGSTTATSAETTDVVAA